MQPGPRPSAGPPQPAGLRSVVDLLRTGVLDAELAALVGLLVEGGVPLVLAGGGSPAERVAVLRALTWSTEVASLDPALNGHVRRRVVIGDLDAAPVDPTLIERLRRLGLVDEAGAGLALGLGAGSLEEVLERLRADPVGLSDDQLSFLGLVLVLEPGGGRPGPPRVASAHYLRPLARDAGGHIQRLGPAVLVTWDPVRCEFEHFAWGVLPELAARIGKRAGDLEGEQAHRARHLVEFAAASDSLEPEHGASGHAHGGIG